MKSWRVTIEMPVISADHETADEVYTQVKAKWHELMGGTGYYKIGVALEHEADPPR